MKNVTIDVKHVTRVEGHGNISVSVSDGEITKLQLAIVESPRFFESFLRGRHYTEAPHITCRICGICSVGHTSASVQGIESATGIQITKQTHDLRRLINFGEQLQSHVLHLYFLAVPDFVGVGSVIPLATSHPDVVKRALRMKRLANDICGAVGGRHIHPIAVQVGGFPHVPSDAELLDLKRRLEESREDVKLTAELYASLAEKLPKLERETEYMSLTHPDEYAFYTGDIITNKDKNPTKADNYRERVIETVVQHSAAKHCCTPLTPSYMAGALSRFNNNYDQLHPDAKKVAEMLGIKPLCTNPFHNNTAQLVEVVHCVEEAITLIDELLTRGLKLEPLEKPTKWGTGAGSTDVPRGILFHEYTVGSDEKIEGANLIIPTGQNLANVEADMRQMVPMMLEADMSKEAMTLQLEMLVRAYDPCISCATHFLNVEWLD